MTGATSVVGGATTQLGFVFDPANNLTVTQSSTDDVRFRIDTGSNRILSRLRRDGSTESYQYDAAGRTRQIGTRRFEYDGQGRLAKISEQGQPLAQYAYNAFGERIKKVVYAGNQKTVTYFFYDGSKLTAEADPSGEITKHFVYVGERAVAAIIDKDIYAIHTDWRGTPVALTDEDQDVVWRAKADVLGRLEIQHAKFEINLRGSNQYYDPESGLHYNTHRYFDPESSRYLTPDPIGQEGGLNLYAFVGGDPANAVDPFGLQSTPTQDWSNASFGDKLARTLQLAMPMFQGQFAQDLRSAIQEALNDLPTTIAVFVAWQIVSATPVGWLVNGLVAAYAAYSLGREAITFARALGQWVQQVNNASSERQLCSAARDFAKLMSQMSIMLGAQVNPARVFRGMRGGGGQLSRNVAPDQRNRPRSRTRLDRLTTRGCFNPYGDGYQSSSDQRGYLNEFGRQVSRQRDALNRLSADEFLAARDAYQATRGRHPDANYQQRAYRQDYEEELRERITDNLANSGFSRAEAESLAVDKAASVMRNYAALHEPDMFAGGYNNPTPCSMGNCSVNSSIGAQWQRVIDELDQYARSAQSAGHGGARMDVHLRVCNRSGK